jgi:hypothetical protein
MDHTDAASAEIASEIVTPGTNRIENSIAQGMMETMAITSVNKPVFSFLAYRSAAEITNIAVGKSAKKATDAK